MTTDGVDERPELQPWQKRILEQGTNPNTSLWASELAHPSADVVYHAQRIANEALQPYIERAEAAERALLKTWRIEGKRFDQCAHCDFVENSHRPFGHAPDCIIPALERRYAIANTTPDAGT